MLCGDNVFNYQLLLCFSLLLQTFKKKISCYFPSIPLLPAFAQVFLRPDMKKEPVGLSEGKHQLINCWSPDPVMCSQQ